VARFFIDAPLITGGSVDVPPPVAHHARRVLRLRDGAAMVLFNGRGGEFSATLSIAGNHVRATVGAHAPIERESPLAVTLVQSWIAADKLDWLVEKAVELGVASIIIAPATRSVVRLTAHRALGRVQKLRDIAIAACAQCGRNRIPPIESTGSLADALQSALSDTAIGVLLLPNAPLGLTGASSFFQRITLAVGPEGGFDDAEIALAQRLGYRAHHLGPRILRTETAGVAALAALQSTLGDLG
jgi:16S rRNA (uracil1498-N3)-methyltransferase